jgi:hypothetical protein
MIMPVAVIQWCDKADQIFELLLKPTTNLKDLWEAGCHWVPHHLPIWGTPVKVISEIINNGQLFHLVMFKSQVMGAEIGYTLLLVNPPN